MACLRLRLPPARKARKSFTSKLHSKLHKRKGIHKHRNRVNPSTTISIRLHPYKFLELHFQRKAHLHRTLLRHRHAHVYVDNLFKEPAHVSQLATESSLPPKAKYVIKHVTDSLVTETSKQLKPQVETSEAGGVTSAADDMWESLEFASPQMHGIDKRAEEFIARFRAEMKDQEKFARRPL